MKKTLITTFFVLLSSLSIAQQNSNPSQAEINAAKAAGANAAGTLRGQAFEVDANGQIVKDANGNPVVQRNSAETMRGAGRMFQSITGTEGIEQVSSPSNGNRTGLANVKINQSFDFNCDYLDPKAQYSAGSLSFKIPTCEGNSQQVTAVQVHLCDNVLRAGTCSSNTDFPDSKKFKITAGAFSQFNGLELGLGCNTQAACRVSVRGAYSFGGSDADMKNRAQQNAQNSSESGSLVGGLRQAVTEGDYSGRMKEFGQPILDCAKRNQDGFTNGQMETCDGQQTVQVSTGKDAGRCTGTRTCIREATTNQNFNRSCIRTFPLTTRTTSAVFPKNVICAIHNRIAVDKEPASIKNTCEPTDDKGAPLKDINGAPVPPSYLGMDLIATTTEPECTEWKKIKDVDTCVQYTTYKYYAKTDVPESKSQSAEPAAVGGACDTNPTSEARHFVCSSQSDSWFGRLLPAHECIVNYEDESGGANGTLELSYLDKPGCGFCKFPTIGESCYAVPSADNDTQADKEDSCAAITEDANCTLSGTQIIELTGSGGLVSSQRETYSCAKGTRTCLEYSQSSDDANCLNSNMAQGLDKPNSAAADDGSMNAALVAAATVDGVAKGVEGTQAYIKIPKIFTGENMRCKRPVGGIGSLLSKNCCRTSLERPKKGNVVQKGCSDEEAKLAAARRSNYAYFVGDYCSRKLRIPRRCLERKQSYCVFPGILPRLIHEQGRAQLDRIAGSSTSAEVQRSPLSYNYFDTGEGRWTAPSVVNGVQVTAWQWPSYCKDPGKAQELLLSRPQANDCPGVVTTYIAACDTEAGCADMPLQPSDGSADWSIVAINPLERLTSALNKYAVVTGACSTQTQACQYEIASYPIGKGGKAIVSKDLTWELYVNVQEAPTQANGAPPPSYYQMNNIGDLMFKGYSVSGLAGGVLPSTVRVDMSRDGGQTWTTSQVPTDLKGKEIALSGTDVVITGYCDLSSNICGYRITGTTTITNKPWGSPENPDCSGFTAGQLAAMDFSKMDLSEWLATVLDKVGANQSPSQLVAQANAQFQNFNSMFQDGNGRVSAANPTSANFARVVPPEGFGPFGVRLAVSGVWPEITGDPARDKDLVTGVTVDWGDCGTAEQLTRVSATEGNGFRATHQYLEPDNDKHVCLGTNLQRNLTHTIKLTVYTTLSGTQTRTLRVENAWAKFPGGNKNNDYVPERTTVNANSGGTPPPPKP